MQSFDEIIDGVEH